MKTLPRYLRRGALAAFCSCLTFFFVLPSRAQTLFLNFNTPGQYTGNFNQWNENGTGVDGGNYSFQESASGGVGNSGCVSVFQSLDMTATYENGSWDFSTNGATILLSVEIQADGQSRGDKVQFGIMNSHTNGFNNNTGVSFESYRFVPSSATVWSLREQYRNSNAPTETILGDVSVTVGHWHKFVIGLTNTSGATGQYNSGCALYDYGVDGLSPETNVISFSTAETHSAGQTIATLSAVWPGLRAYEDGGIDAWDNFLVYTPFSPPVITQGPTNSNAVIVGQPATFEALVDGPGAISSVWLTNGVIVAGATNSTYTTTPYNAAVTNVAIVASNANGFATNSNTVVLATAASVTNTAATAVQNIAAIANGQVLSTGGSTPNITIFYGTNNGGTNAAAWANSIALGRQSGSFDAQLAGLTPGATYYFTAEAANQVGPAWAVPSGSFITLAVAPSPTTYVNPFIGTSPSPLASYGFSFDTGDVFPGATFPRGMLQFSPDTPSNLPGGYDYQDTSIEGFSLRHFSGRGCTCYQDIAFKPFLGAVTASPQNHNSAYWTGFSHTNESASPGYYSVLLNNGVQVQLTATMRTGMAEFTFPSTNAATLLIDAGASVNGTTANTSITIVGTNQIQGYATAPIGCGSQNYTIYFVAQFEQGFSNPGTWNGATVSPGVLSNTGAQVGAFVSFNTTVNPVVTAKVGISFVSIGNALVNLNAENTNWNFAALQSAASVAWSNVLSKVVIGGGTISQLQDFYTALYHCFFHPDVFNDANGQYEGMDFQVHTVSAGHAQYENITAWDNDRSLIQLISILQPDAASDIAQSLVNWAQQGGGGLPRWEQANRNSQGNVGDGPLIILASAYAFGATNFDTSRALTAMKLNAGNVNTTSDGNTVRSGLSYYLNIGYVPNDLFGQAVSSTLEYNGADFALYAFSQALGDTDPADASYLEHSGYWQNLFNTNNGLIQPRNSDGSFVAGITPGSTTGDMEGSASQYTWFVPFDVEGVFNDLGGNTNVIPVLNSFFTTLNAGYVNRSNEWVGNEPCECDPWEYDYAGQPWQTQNTIWRIVNQCFTNNPSGFPGNDDGGAISSWYVFGSLGMFPEVPGVGGLVLGSPLFPSATINLENGRQIVIQGSNSSAQNYYVQSLTINGTNSTSLWLPFATIGNGANLVFNLTNVPTSWGGDPSDAPPSFPAPPPFPIFVTATLVSNTQVTVSWDTSLNATSYNVKRATNSGGEVTITNVTGTSFIDVAPPTNVTYYYEISASNSFGQSPNSSEVSAQTVAQAGPPAWLLFDNFNGDAAGTLNGQTGSGGLGAGWTNFGTGTSLVVVTNGGPFVSGNYVQFNAGGAGGAGAYEAGLGIASNSTAATVFLQFCLPGIQITNGEVGAVGSANTVSMNFEMDTVATPGDAQNSASVEFNYDNSVNGSANGFRIRNGGAFVNPALTSGGSPYVPVPGNVYDAWFVINAAQGTYQVYLADSSVSGANKDAGGLGATATLLYGAGTATVNFGFRNGASGQAVNTFVAGFVDATGTVAQTEFDNIYVDRNSADVTFPPPPMPHITGFSLNGTALTISATNGPASGAFYLLMTTNLGLPVSQWTPVATNSFNRVGNLNLTTNIVTPGNGQAFYILQVP